MLLDLPADLLLKIAEHIVPVEIDEDNSNEVFTTVCALAGTCRTFRQILRLPDLWTSVSVSCPPFDAEDGADDKHGCGKVPVDAQALLNNLAPYAVQCRELGVRVTSSADLATLIPFLSAARAQSLNLSFSDATCDAAVPNGPWLRTPVTTLSLFGVRRSALVQGAIHALGDITQLRMAESELPILGDVGGTCTKLESLTLARCSNDFETWLGLAKQGLALPSVTKVQIAPPTVETLVLLAHTPHVKELVITNLVDAEWESDFSGPLPFPRLRVERLHLALGPFTKIVATQLADMLSGGVAELKLDVDSHDASWVVAFLKECPFEYGRLRVGFDDEEVPKRIMDQMIAGGICFKILAQESCCKKTE